MRIFAAAVLVPLVFFTLNQLVLQILKPAEQDLDVRIAYAFQPTIYLLFLLGAAVILFFIFRKLRPLFGYIRGDTADYDRARKASLAVPWMLILFNTGLWLTFITLFYMLHGFETKGGIPYFWSLTTNSMCGFVSAVLGSLLINRTLIPVKILLSMTDIRQGERDVFIRIKMPLVIFSGFIFTCLLLSYAGSYFSEISLHGYAPIPFLSVVVFPAVSLIALLPLTLNVVLSLSEDRIQRRFLGRRLKDLTGGGDLSGQVHLINFDEIGALAMQINGFIDTIRELVVRVDETGKNVVATSREIDQYAEELSKEMLDILNAVNGVDRQMDEQRQEFEYTRDSLLDYFHALGRISDNIDNQSASVQQTSSAIEELAASIKSVNTSAREVEKLTQGLSDITTVGSDQIRDFIGSIRRIEDASKSVSDIQEHIDALADQIDMLAMNAAIEAAHAGETGKGFGVVADEVRALAETSSAESGEIGSHIRAMLEIVKTSKDKIAESERVFEDIRSHVENALNHFRQIFNALEEESLGVDELLLSVNAMVGITEDLRSIADGQRDRNLEMEERIKGVFSRFDLVRQGIEEQRSNRTGIEEALNGMKDIAGKNLDTVHRLKEQLDRFSVGG